MAAPLDDAAVVQHHDHVAVLHGGQPVGDDEHRAALHQLVHAPLHQQLRAGVDGGGGLVQNHHRRIGHGGPGDGDELPLALGKVSAVGGEQGVVSLGQAADEVVGVGQPGRGVDLLFGGVQLAVADVLHHRAGEQVGVLQNDAQRPAQIGLFDLVDVDAVVTNLAVGNVVEAVDQVGDGGLARARSAHEGHLLAGFGVQGNVVEHFLALFVGKVHVRHAHVALQQGVGHAAVGLVGMLPGPLAGAGGGFGDVAVFVHVGVDQRHVAFVRLAGLIQQPEHPLRAGHGGNDGVHLLRNLADGHGEGAGQLQEGHDGAQRQPAHAADGQRAADHRQQNVLQVAQVAHDGAHDVAQLVGFVCLNVQRVVQLVEFVPGGGLVVEHLYHLLAVDHFFHKAVQRAQGGLLGHEIPGGFRADLLGDQHHHHHKGQGENRQINVQQNHVHQHRHHRNGRGNQLRYGGTDEVAQGFSVVGVPAHNVAVGMGVKVLDGQRLHVREHLVPQLLQRALRNGHHQEIVQPGAHDARRVNQRHLEHRPHQSVQRRVLLAGQGGDVIVDQRLQKQAGPNAGLGGNHNAHQHDQQHVPVGRQHHLRQPQGRALVHLASGAAEAGASGAGAAGASAGAGLGGNPGIALEDLRRLAQTGQYVHFSGLHAGHFRAHGGLFGLFRFFIHHRSVLPSAGIRILLCKFRCWPAAPRECRSR